MTSESQYTWLNLVLISRRIFKVSFPFLLWIQSYSQVFYGKGICGDNIAWVNRSYFIYSSICEIYVNWFWLSGSFCPFFTLWVSFLYCWYSGKNHSALGKHYDRHVLSISLVKSWYKVILWMLLCGTPTLISLKSILVSL